MPLNGVIWVILTPKSMCFMGDFGIGFYAMDFARFGKVLKQACSGVTRKCPNFEYAMGLFKGYKGRQ